MLETRDSALFTAKMEESKTARTKARRAKSNGVLLILTILSLKNLPERRRKETIDTAISANCFGREKLSVVKLMKRRGKATKKSPSKIKDKLFKYILIYLLRAASTTSILIPRLTFFPVTLFA